MTDRPADRTEHYREVFAESRRMRDSRGQEQLLVTLRMHLVEGDDTICSWEYSLDMDTLERFAS